MSACDAPLHGRTAITAAIREYWPLVRWDDPAPGYVSVSDKGGYWHIFARSETDAAARIGLLDCVTHGGA